MTLRNNSLSILKVAYARQVGKGLGKALALAGKGTKKTFEGVGDVGEEVATALGRQGSTGRRVAQAGLGAAGVAGAADTRWGRRWRFKNKILAPSNFGQEAGDIPRSGRL